MLTIVEPKLSELTCTKPALNSKKTWIIITAKGCYMDNITLNTTLFD